MAEKKTGVTSPDTGKEILISLKEKNLGLLFFLPLCAVSQE